MSPEKVPLVEKHLHEWVSDMCLCYKGICPKRADPQDFWNDSTNMAAMITSNVGARYGQFTGASATSTANPILAATAAGKQRNDAEDSFATAK